MEYQQEEPCISPRGTILARHIASGIDNILMGVLAIVLIKQVDENNIPVQAIVMVGVYLGYFLVSEALTARTLGKLVTGLKVVNFDGDRCTIEQAGIRTLFRLVEVNPFLLGALPAAVRIIFSRNKQRFGDRFAQTCLLYTSPSPRDQRGSRMPSSA